MAFLLENETYKIRKCIYDVYNRMGCGFSEKLYQDALEWDFQLGGVPFEREKHLTFTFRDKVMAHDYFLDFLCYDKVIVELKAVSELAEIHRAQVYNYLRASNLDIGLLVNFGEEECKIERLYNYHKNKK